MMKKIRLKWALALCASFLWLPGGCGDKKDDPQVDPELAAAPGELSFECDETVTKKTVTVTTNVDSWEVDVPEWVIITDQNSESFSVMVEENLRAGLRKGDLVITGGEATPVTIEITQSGAEVQFSVSLQEMEIVADPLVKQTVTVTTNVDNWDITKPDWLTVSDKLSGSFAVLAEKNLSTDFRSGEIIVTAEGADPDTISVVQLGAKGDWAADNNLKTLKAFPEAEGFGALVTGGRGGVVVEVTTLEDDAENPPVGSLRWALNQHGDNPKIIVFRVSGIIELKGTGSRQGELRKGCKNVTIAGQTAPGDGICIMGDKVNFGGSDNLIIRHVRFRAGAMPGHANGKGSIGIENAKNWIIDHCTFGWSPEENMTIYDNQYTTIQWCIVHEGLYDAGHGKGPRGYGAQWGGQNVTFHHNLLAHNYSRSPRFNGARGSNDLNVLIDFVNNVNYNWGKQNACYGSDIESDGVRSNRTNFVNNYYKPGPCRPASQSSYFSQSSVGTAGGSDVTKVAQWYMSGNIMEGNATLNADNYKGVDMGGYSQTIRDNTSLWKSAAPFVIPAQYSVAAETAQNAYTSVLAGAGAFPRDAVDARIVSEVRSGTALYGGSWGAGKGIIDKPSDAGGYPTYVSLKPLADTDGDGMPDLWEKANGLDPNDPADGKTTTLTGGIYTNLEVYLYDLVREK